MVFSYPTVPENVRTNEEYLRSLMRVVNQVMKGKTNNVGEVTLGVNSDTTEVEDVRVGGDSVILLSPLTLNGAGAVGTTFISSVDKAHFTISHANNSQTDRVFGYVVIG